MTTLVESCFCLEIGTLKKDLRLARERKTGIMGFINIAQGNSQSVADYRIESGTEFDYLVISYDEEEQRIRLAESELTYGPRSWFICDCDRRVGKLYLLPHGTQFKCRYCHQLAYELTTFNRNSKQGQFMYQMNRMIKIVRIRENMRSILYAGHYTRRFNRFLNLSDRVGLRSNREDARILLTAMEA